MDNIIEGIALVNKQEYYSNNQQLFIMQNNSFILSKNISERASKEYLCIFPFTKQYCDYLKKIKGNDYELIYLTYLSRRELNTQDNDLITISKVLSDYKITSIKTLKDYYDSYKSLIGHTKQLRLQDSKLNNNIAFVYILNPTCILNWDCLNNIFKPAKEVDTTNNNNYPTNKEIDNTNNNSYPTNKDTDKPNEFKESFSYFWWYIWNIPQHKGWAYFFIYVLPLIAFIIGLIIGRIS